MKNIVKDAIFFDSTYSCSYPSAGPGQFKDIIVKNVTCNGVRRYGIYINGSPGAEHDNISLSNITIDGAKKAGAYLRYCTNSTFDKVNIKNSKQAWIIDPDSTSGLSFKNCNPTP